jgi:hypothetical protein
MACISPPEPPDVSLLAVLAGEGKAEVVQHLEDCPHCRERAEVTRWNTASPSSQA